MLLDYTVAISNSPLTQTALHYGVQALFTALSGFFLAVSYGDLSLRNLLEKCCTGDPVRNSGWHEFECRFGRHLVRYIVHELKALSALTLVQQDVEFINELKQEVYCKLLRNDCKALRDFRGQTERAFFAYLHQITSRLARSHVKKELSRKRDLTLDISLPFIKSMAGDRTITNNTEDETKYRALQDYVLHILQQRYPSKNKKRDILIFKLRVFEEMSPEELLIHYDLGTLTRGGIDTIVHRIREWLQSEIKK